MTMDKRQQKRFEIIDYAIEYNFVIDPSKGMERFIDNILKFGYCPCDSTRPDCPCTLAAEEVAKYGRCRCSLFWADYQAFRKILRPLKGEKGEGIKRETA
jgi:ferredoxin-thioredoxin reductase catalytic subunit